MMIELSINQSVTGRSNNNIVLNDHLDIITFATIWLVLNCPSFCFPDCKISICLNSWVVFQDIWNWVRIDHGNHFVFYRLV